MVCLALFDSIHRPEWREGLNIMTNNLYTNYAYNNADAEMQSIITAVNTVKSKNADAGTTLYKWVVAAQERLDDATIAKVVCTAVERNADVNSAMTMIRDGLRKAAGM